MNENRKYHMIPGQGRKPRRHLRVVGDGYARLSVVTSSVDAEKGATPGAGTPEAANAHPNRLHRSESAMAHRSHPFAPAPLNGGGAA